MQLTIFPMLEDGQLIKINLFSLTSVVSSFELGGLEFYGRTGSFAIEHYCFQDMQMIFISSVNFSYSA
jgi:hypothetical protein